jgi:hypothetical protein
LTGALFTHLIMGGFFNDVILALYNRHCPVTRLRLKSEPKLWITPRLLEVFKKRDLAHEYSNFFGNSPARESFTNYCFNDEKRHENRLKRETKRDYLTCALSINVTPNRFWKLCGSFGIHSKRSDSNIDFEPDEINDHFAASVNNVDVLDNSNIPPRRW